MLGSFLQIVMAIAVVLIMFVIGFAINNMEKLKALKDSGVIRKETVIYNGVKDMKDPDSFETLNPLAANYKDLAPAINQRGGAEYSYSFWMYMNNGSLFSGTSVTSPDQSFQNYKPFVLLLRGEPVVVPYKGMCFDPNSSSSSLKKDVLVKNPMIRLDDNGKVLTVEVNTFHKPDGVNPAASPNLCKMTAINNWLAVNTYRFGVKEIAEMVGKWFLVTVIVQDTYPTDPIPIRNKVRIQIWINEDRKVDSYMDGSLGSLNIGRNATILRTVASHLHIAPAVKDSITTSTLSAQVTSAQQLLISDLSYFNYALDSDAISKKFRKGHSKKYYTKENNPNIETPDVLLNDEIGVGGRDINNNSA